MKNKFSPVKIFSVVMCVIILSYIAYNAFAYSYSPVDTVRIIQKTTSKSSLTFTCFTVRDEKIIDREVSGTLIPLASDGKRVASGDTIAVACNSEQDASDYAMLQKAKEETEKYISLGSTSGIMEMSLDKLNGEISDAYNSVMDSVISGKYDELSESVSDYTEKSAMKQLISGDDIDISKKTTALDEQIKTLEAKNIEYVKIASPNSGYYINNIDGYEDSVDYKDISSLKPEQIEKLIESSPSKLGENSIGKIVENYCWYVLGVVDKKYAADFDVGKTIKVNFPDNGINDVSMTVKSISASGDKMSVVLSCSLMNEDFANMRTEKVEVILKSSTGYKVPAQAVRFDENGQSGVYVLRGKIISFINVEIIDSDKEYAFIDSCPDGNQKLTLYDDIVIKGKGLYDGKVIK